MALAQRCSQVDIRGLVWAVGDAWPDAGSDERCAAIAAGGGDARFAVRAAWANGRAPVVLEGDEATVAMVRASSAGVWCGAALDEAAVAVEALARNPALCDLLVRRGARHLAGS